MAILIISINLNSQERYAYLPEGKTKFVTSNEKILVCYKNGNRPTLLNNHTSISTDFDANNNNSSEYIQLNETFQNEDSIKNLFLALKLESNVVYVTPLLFNGNSKLQGITDKVIVKPKIGQNILSLLSLFGNLGIIKYENLIFTNDEFILTINGKQQYDALDVSNTLYESNLFEFAEPEFIILNAFKTNDPIYNQQWGLNNTGGLYNGNTGSDIHINPAWNITSGAGIKVAVIDMGVDLTHPDLVNNLLPGYDALGQGTNGNQKGNDAHGTGCAGIIAAQANNNLGITGVAYNSKIIPIRVGQNGSLSTLSTANGINWAVNDGADILSCSFGGGSSNVELQAINNAGQTHLNLSKQKICKEFFIPTT